MMNNQDRIEEIIRKHVHDVRNSINVLDLEATLLAELITDVEAVETLGRMRTELVQLESTISALHYKVAEPRLSTLTAYDLWYMWKRQIAPLENSSRQISWSAEPALAKELTIDARAMVFLARELVMAAWGRTPGAALKAAVLETDQTIVMELREAILEASPAVEPASEHRRLVERNGGTLEISEDPRMGERVMTLRFPVVTPPAGFNPREDENHAGHERE